MGDKTNITSNSSRPSSIKDGGTYSHCSISTAANELPNTTTAFMSSYAGICKDFNSLPVPSVKVIQSNCHLEILVDQIKLEEWRPLFKAMYGDKSLHWITIKSKQNVDRYLDYADTEEKAREVKKGPALYSKFTMTCLIETLVKMLATSKVLTCLELQQLPVNGKLVEILAKGLCKTRSLQHLSLQRCPLGDEGVINLSRAIRNRPNIMTLDLTECSVTTVGAYHLAQLIKFQELERYGESWKHTLRYRDIDHNILPGLRRITLNRNYEIGNIGLQYIIDVVIDDYWIKAIDMQECGITMEGGLSVLNLVKKNRQIVVFDIRKNEIYDFNLLKDIVLTLGENSLEDDSGEYLWLEIDSILPDKSETTITSSASVTSFNISESKKKSTKRVPSAGNLQSKNARQEVFLPRQCKSQTVTRIKPRYKIKPPILVRNGKQARALSPKGSVSSQESHKKQNDKDEKSSKESDADYSRTMDTKDKRDMIINRLKMYNQNQSERLSSVGSISSSENSKNEIDKNEKVDKEIAQDWHQRCPRLEPHSSRDVMICSSSKLSKYNDSSEITLSIKEFEAVRERYIDKPFHIYQPTDLLALVRGESILGFKRPLFATEVRCPPLRPLT